MLMVEKASTLPIDVRSTGTSFWTARPTTTGTGPPPPPLALRPPPPPPVDAAVEPQPARASAPAQRESHEIHRLASIRRTRFIPGGNIRNTTAGALGFQRFRDIFGTN